MRITVNHSFISCLFLAIALISARASAEGMLPGSDSSEPYKIDAEKLDYFDKEQKLIYTGNVIATQGETKVHGSVMTILLEKTPVSQKNSGEESKSQIRRIEFQGPVTVVQKGKIGTGDTAIYDRGQDKWFLKGNVTLTTDGNITKGNLLTYNLSDSTAIVTGGGSTGRVTSVIPVEENKNSKDGKNHNASSAKPK